MTPIPLENKWPLGSLPFPTISSARRKKKKKKRALKGKTIIERDTQEEKLSFVKIGGSKVHKTRFRTAYIVLDAHDPQTGPDFFLSPGSRLHGASVFFSLFPLFPSIFRHLCRVRARKGERKKERKKEHARQRHFESFVG